MSKQFFIFRSPGDPENTVEAYRNAASACAAAENIALTVTVVDVTGADPNLKFWSRACTIESVYVDNGQRVGGSCTLLPTEICSLIPQPEKGVHRAPKHR